MVAGGSNVEVDLALALQLQAQFTEEFRQQQERNTNNHDDSIEIVSTPSKNKIQSKNRAAISSPRGSHRTTDEVLSVSLIDPVWELVDPTPDIYALFCTYNDQFFWGKLYAVAVAWSPRMTVCAGVCSYERRGGLCSVKLSVPLLKLRPRKDLIETLLHEMIHAFLFVTANNRDRDGHGPEFHKHMYRINKRARTGITVYHSFHDEVAVYKQHVWQCTGPCRLNRPYYGLVKRSMNRVPGPNDLWWARHVDSCGGTFKKIKEPDGYGKKGIKRKAEDEGGSSKRTNGIGNKTNTGKTGGGDLRNFFTGSGKSLGNATGKSLINTGGKSSTNTGEKSLINAKESSSITTSEKSSKSKGKSGKKSSDGSKSRVPSGTANNNNSSLLNSGASKIKGFSNNTTKDVKVVDVANASNSNIFGFSKGSNKSSGADNAGVGNHMSRNGTSRGRDTNSGTSRTSGNGTNTNGFTGTGRGKGRGRGSGTIMGFGGSRTIVLPPKLTGTKTATDNKVKSGNNDNISGNDEREIASKAQTFDGSGYKLSGSRGQTTYINNTRNDFDSNQVLRPVSRLLAEYDSTAASISELSSSKQTVKHSNKFPGILADSDDTDESDDEPLNSVFKPNHRKKLSFKDNNSLYPHRKSDPSTKENCDSPIRFKHSGSNNYKNDGCVLVDSESDDDGEGFTAYVSTCPLCECEVSREEFVNHIATCVGDWGEPFDDVSDNGSNEKVNKKPGVDSEKVEHSVDDNLDDNSKYGNDNDVDFFDEKECNRSKNDCINVSITNSSLYDADFFDDIDECVLDKLEKDASQKCADSKTENKSDNTKTTSGLCNIDNLAKNTHSLIDDDFIYISDTDSEFDDGHRNEMEPAVHSQNNSNNRSNNSNETYRSNGSGSINSRSCGGNSGSSSNTSDSKNSSSSNSSSNNNNKVRLGEVQKYPCPVCQEMYTEEYITTTHLNTHFT